MRYEQSPDLTSERFPARLDARQAAKYLGFPDHDIPILVAAGLLKPLGKKLEQSAPRYFARVEIEEKAVDVAWLNKATDAVRSHWRRKNLARKGIANGERKTI
jgi:hypothetical protein